MKSINSNDAMFCISFQSATRGAIFCASTIIIFLLAGLICPAQVIHIPADQPSIQAGIDAASTGDTVLVDEGTYTENIRFNGKAITLGSQYIIDGNESHIENTIIDGSGATDPDSASTVMFIHGEDTNSIINGFTITGGTGTLHETYGVQNGGGINVYDAGAMIINNIITGNHVSGTIAGGAGIECFSHTGDEWVIIDNNTINYNSSTADGFSAFAGGISTLMNSKITNNIVEYNTCTNIGGTADGGGIEIERISATSMFYIGGNTIRYNELSGTGDAMGGGIMSIGCGATIENNIIEWNKVIGGGEGATWGGGIAIHSASSGVTIVSNSIRDNYIESYNAYGPGMNLYNNNGITLIRDNDISDNNGYAYNFAAGGAIRLHTTLDKTTIKNNWMFGNTMTSDGTAMGGAINIYPAGTEPIFVVQNKIGNNHATYGGAIRLYNTFNISFINNLFAGNASSFGGAMYIQQNADDESEQPDHSKYKYYKPEQYVTSSVKADTSIPALINNTFEGNSAVVRAGAIYADMLVHGTMLIFNSAFWENEAQLNFNIFNSSDEDALIAWCDIDPEGVYGDWQGRSNINEDPIFIDSLCHLVGPTSPCADGGADSVHFYETVFYAPDDDYEDDTRPYNNGIPDIGADETDIWIGILPEKIQTIRILVIDQNHPNPCSVNTTFSYTLLKPCHLKIEIFDVQGKKVAEPVNEYKTAGKHQEVWNGSGYASGIYSYKITAGEQSEVRKMIIR